jgi:hypothetical protein
VGRYSSVGVETVWGSSLGEGEIFRAVWPAHSTLGIWSFPGVKRPGRGVDHPAHTSPDVKERVELCL